MLISFVSCDKSSIYLSGKKSSFFSPKWIIGEKKGDSIQLWYLQSDFDGRYSNPYKTEILPYKPFKGIYFSIESITKNDIVVNGISLKGVRTMTKYDKIRNIINGLDIDEHFEDSTRKVLDERCGAISHIYRYSKYKDSLIEALPYTDFEKQYIKYRQTNLALIKKDVEEKKAYYEKLIHGEIVLDSMSFAENIARYDNGYYDRRILYYFINNKPELFFINIQFGLVYLDIGQCDSCFTKMELDTMYCKLKPFRYRDTIRIRMFERLGTFNCPY